MTNTLSIQETHFPSFQRGGRRFSASEGDCSGFMCEQPSLNWKSHIPRWGSCSLMEALSSSLSGAASSVDPSKLSHDKRKAPSHFDLRPNKRIASEIVESCEISEISKKNPEESEKKGNSLPTEIRPEFPDGCHKNYFRKNERGHYPQEDQEDYRHNHYQARHRPTDCNRNRDHDRDHRDRVQDRDHLRDYDRNFHHNRNHDRVHDREHRDRVQEQDHRYGDRDDRIQVSPERKPRDPPRRQMSEPDHRRPPPLSSIDRKQWLKELEEDWVRHCTVQWKSDVQKLIHLHVVQAEDSRYSCIICRTGKMSLTTMMGSHVSGKKHQVLAAKSGIYWHPETPTFKNFKNIILGNRNRPPPAKSLSVPLSTGRWNTPSPQEKTIPHVIPKLDRNHVVPLYLKSKNTPAEGKTEPIPEMWVEEMEMTERMAEQLSEQLLWEEMRENMSEDVVEYNSEISEKLGIPENGILKGNSENQEILKKEIIPEIPDHRDPLESFLTAGAYPSMCPSGFPMDPCDILSKWNQLQYDLKSTPPSFGPPISSGSTQQQPESGQFYWTGEWNHPQQSWVQQMEQQQQHQPD